MCSSNNRLKIRETKTEHTEQKNSTFTVIVEDFNISLLVIDRFSRPKKKGGGSEFT